MRNVAVIDIGKTNTKLALVDLETLSEVTVVTRPNTVQPGPPWPHLDIEGNWTFLLDALSDVHANHGVDAISITTHGASLALLDAEGRLAAPVLDYEHTGPDECAVEYNSIRPPFAETGSPRLGMGLNAGAQLYWQFRTNPGLLSRTVRIVTYPQYWAYRLSGVAATEVTSLGCHTDLWNPYKRDFSTLVSRLCIETKLAPVRPAGCVLGPILPAIAKRTGLPAATPVYCGIHDSNASLLPHLLTRPAPYSVVSSGTWVIAMAIGGRPVELNPALDTLVNVNIFGDPVPSARFMGGREHDIAMAGPSAEPTADDVEWVLGRKAMIFPAVVPEAGPFSGRKAIWLDEPEVGTGRRTAAVGFYLALMTAHCLDLVRHEGAVILEGPFARNECYRLMLAAATGSEVLASGGMTGTSQGAALLVHRSIPRIAKNEKRSSVFSGSTDKLTEYIGAWMRRL